MKQEKDFSVVFKSIEEAKRDGGYSILQDAMAAANDLQDPIEKLREIILDSEQSQYNILITA